MDRQKTHGAGIQADLETEIMELGKASDETRGVVGVKEDFVLYMNSVGLGRD